MMDNTAHANAPERLSTFQLGRYHFGVDIQYLKEVVPLPEYTPLPNVEDIYLGVFNLRGEIFPIADISTLLGMQPKPIYADDMVMLLEFGELVLGILVDKIMGMVSYLPTEVKIARGLLSPRVEAYISGMVEKSGQQYFILDVHRLFNSHEILAHI